MIIDIDLRLYYKIDLAQLVSICCKEISHLSSKGNLCKLLSKKIVKF